MNKERRKTIATILAQIEEACSVLEGARDALEPVLEEEQEAFDNMPESLQDGDKGAAAQTAIDALEFGLDAVISALGGCEDAATYLADAIQ